MEKDDNEMNQMLNQDNKLQSSCKNWKSVFLGLMKCLFLKFLVPKRGSETETPANNINVIFFLLPNLLIEIRNKWKQMNIQPI